MMTHLQGKTGKQDKNTYIGGQVAGVNNQNRGEVGKVKQEHTHGMHLQNKRRQSPKVKEHK